MPASEAYAHDSHRSRYADAPLPRLHVWVIGNPTSGGMRGAAVLGRIAKVFQATYGAAAVQETQSSLFLSLTDTAADSAFAAPPATLERVWASAAAPSTAAAGPTPPITPPASPPSSSPPGGLSHTVAVRTMLIHTDRGGHAKPVSAALSRLILASRLSPPAALHTQHVVLVVGGDGTLSEAVNGLCEGTLAAYRRLTGTNSSSSFSSSSAPSSSHARVEAEAAVFSHLLPALMYVPGGTGADFAKLGLCCATPEAALHVVRDGLAKALSESSRTRAMGISGVAPQEVDLTRGSAACVGYAVDVGRIEFLSTGRRHYFINICSMGMSCDVIRRGERFKQNPFIAKLGGTVLFALSALVSLLLMTPKPLYLCKLPPRTRVEPEALRPLDGDRASPSSSPSSPSSPLPAARHTPLAELAAFAPLEEQLERLRAHLPTASSSSSSPPPQAAAAAAAESTAAYACHRDDCMPPPHARVVRCTTQTPKHDLQQLLDITEEELQRLRRREQAVPTQRDAPPLRRGDTLEPRTTSPVFMQSALHDSPHHTLRKREEEAAACGSSSGVDDLSAMTWVELPSSMVAFANGRWYGGGMHVAPHANPTDSMLSCTNWVATVLPFISGVLSLYTGRHLRWSSTSAFEGERFLVCNTPPRSIDFDVEPLYMEADGEVLEAVPAIVELAGKITFLVPRWSQPSLGDAAPGTTRARLEARWEEEVEEAEREAGSGHWRRSAAVSPTAGTRLWRSAGGVGSLLKRSGAYARRWLQRSDGGRSGRVGGGGGEPYGATLSGVSGGTSRRTREGGEDENV